MLLQERHDLGLDAGHEPDRCRGEDQPEGGAAVLAHEDLVLGRGEVEHAGLRELRAHRLEHRCDVAGALLDRLACRDRDDGEHGCVGAAVAVRREQPRLGLVTGLAGQREVEAQALSRGACRGGTGKRCKEPEQADQQPVVHDELAQAPHGISPVQS